VSVPETGRSEHRRGAPPRRQGQHRAAADSPGDIQHRRAVVTPMLRESVIVVVLALLLSLVVKTWLVQAFYIPSGSMEDT
jgi:signal peptidase I